eukprot:gene12807-16066_t
MSQARNGGGPARNGGGRGGRGSSGDRHHPYDRSEKRQPNHAEEEEAEFETPVNSIKIGGTADPRELARTICRAIKSGDEPPALLTIGNNSINQAVKSIAIARQELKEEGIDIGFQPAFRHVNRTRPLIAFYLSQVRPKYGTLDELTVGSGSKIVSVAGAVAGRIRDGNPVALSAIGVDAVTNAVLAAGNARLFLEQDALDIKVQPEFFKIEKNGMELNGLRFIFLSESI